MIRIFCIKVFIFCQKFPPNAHFILANDEKICYVKGVFKYYICYTIIRITVEKDESLHKGFKFIL